MYSVFSENVSRRVAKMKYPSQQYFLDENDCLVSAEHVESLQKDYHTAGEAFYFSQMPMFLRKIRELRNEDTSLSKDEFL